MTAKDSTEELNTALEGMRGKSKALNDSLRVLAEEGFDRLAKSAAQATARSGDYQRSNRGIASAELSKLLRQELSSGLQEMFRGLGGESGGQSQGGFGGVNIIVHNNTSSAVSVHESADAFDRKSLEITIDQMVANSLLRGRQTSGVMRTLFGLAPSLLGR